MLKAYWFGKIEEATAPNQQPQTQELMAEVSSSSPLKNNHVNEVADHMEPAISTPLQHEPKRKRQHNNNETTTTTATDTPRRKKPRKKMYRPKVFGEGRRKKSKLPKAPANPKPKKPKTPKPRKTPKPVAPKLVVPSGTCEEKGFELQHDDIVTCRDVEFETADKALAEVKESHEEDHSKSIVVHTSTLELTNSLGGWFCGLSSNVPLECKRKRTRRGQPNNLQPFFFGKRKRTPMVRKCNIASLIAHSKSLQLLRNRQNHNSMSEKETTIHGKMSLNSYDILDEFDCQAPSDSKSNDKDASTEPEAVTKDANSEFSDTQSHEKGNVWKIGDAIHTQKLSHNSKATMRWLDIKQYSAKSRMLNGTSENTPPERSLSLPRVVVTGASLLQESTLSSFQGLLDASRGRSLVMQQNFTIPANPSGSANELRHALNVMLWKRSEAARNNHAHFRFTGTNDNIDLLQENSKNEGTNSSQVKQIIPYAREQGKKTSTREHNQSYVHSMEGAIVPHTPKKKVSGKVNLDPRDIIVWKLLNEDQSNNDQEKADIHDEEWWANERETFRVRIDAFIARMSAILGDRRFSPWKGSVVDSVVGVFLTQNVSDHLSSSAYMSLAATFPIQAKRNHTENYQQSTQTNNGYFPSESKWTKVNMFEDKKTTEDLEETEELMYARDAIIPQDLLESLIKLSLDETLPSATCLKDGCGTCLCADNILLRSNKSIFAEEHYSSSQTSTLLFGRNQDNKILESQELGCKNQDPSETVHMVNCLCSECKRKPMSGLKNKVEKSNRYEETVEVDLQFTSNEKSQTLIELTSDANACRAGSDIQTSNGGIKKTTEFFNYYHEEMEPCSQLYDSTKKLDGENIRNQESVTQGAQNLEDRDCNDLNDEKKTENSQGKAKKSKMKQEIDWNSLREKWDSMRKAYSSSEPRSSDHMDSVDWEAVRSADLTKIADAIKERGQHNIIAGRIKDFLNRTARIHGHVDLEWLKQAPPNDVKEYLLDIDGIGLKSVECIRLLSLQQVAFPVDVNVGRIAVRIGWVPLEPLPDEVQMHLLETFPMMDSIQKYLWPRLSMLDQRTLYELHYQLITFGKVFCSKRAPNCKACPLREECRYYASAYANEMLKLPGLPEKNSTMVPENKFEGIDQGMNTLPMTDIVAYPCSGSSYLTNISEPIIEVPQSPEPAYDESQLTDIEDLHEYDSDDVPVIRLSYGQSTTASQNGMDDENTRALVPLLTKVASFPIRKLKHIERLRTEHETYELPDNHPLLHELEKREPNDPCPYLLCIYSPGETKDSSEPPNTKCAYRETGKLCTEGSCSSCNIVREENHGTVRGTILIPCRTGMRGKFPLNGTYFQVNEVFADDETSKNPIHVPREWIWDLPRRIAYFGTSTATIFRGLPIHDIQNCFQKGFICVRGFNRKTRTPKRLAKTLHMPPQASLKARANKDTGQPKKPYASNFNSPPKP